MCCLDYEIVKDLIEPCKQRCGVYDTTTTKTSSLYTPCKKCIYDKVWVQDDEDLWQKAENMELLDEDAPHP